jgi:hypothetical protein
VSGFSGGGDSGYTFPSGDGKITVKGEDVSIGEFDTINFTGADVSALAGAGQANIYIPAVSYASHWNTSSGDTGNQSVTESISRTTARISTPSGGEGTPFQTGGWANSDQSASLQTSATFTTPGLCTGFGGDATATVTVYSSDGTTVLETYTTPSLAANGAHTTGNVTVTITNYAADDNRFQANMSVAVGVGAVLTTAGFTGGRYNCKVVMTTDTATDGTGPYTYTQTSVFLDTNPSTPSVTAVTIAETGGSVVTKHLSGLEYYTTGSDFTLGATGIDNLNANTAKTTQNIRISAGEYGINNLNQSPFGTGSGNFSGWASANNNTGTAYSNTAYAVNQNNVRYVGTAANASAFARDTWASGSTTNSANASIALDTHGTTSTNTFESFDDESRRQTSTYNGGATGGNWTSTNDLVATEAMVYAGQLLVPTQAVLNSGGTNANWGTFSPNAGSQPNYTGFGAPATYYRSIVDTAGTNRSSFQIVFTGTFISNATTDLANSNLEIYIRRIASAGGGGAGPGANPLRLHGSNYNFATFDDGASVDGSYIREASSSGNTVNGTFGGFSCENGVYMQITIANAGIKLSSFSVTFF